MSHGTDPRSRAIDFVVAGGALAGLGHLARCATLADEARRRGWHVRAFLAGDPVAEAAWHERTGRGVDGAWTDWTPGARDPIVALDFPQAKDGWVERLRRLALRCLVVDDERLLEGPDWILLPGLHHSIRVGSDGPRTTARRLVGGRYAILPAAHRDAPPVALDRRDRVLLSLGGADPAGVTGRLVPALDEALARAAHDVSGVDVVLGPAFRDPTPDFRDALEGRGFRVHRGLAPEAMAERMTRARLAVVGFGTTLTELAWHGTPFVCVTQQPSDLGPAQALEGVGIGRVLGDARDLDVGGLPATLAAALADRDWQRATARRARAALGDGFGARCVFDRLEDGTDTDPVRDARRAPAPQPSGVTYPAGDAG